MLTAEVAALPLRPEGVVAGGLGAAAAQGLQERRTDPGQSLRGEAPWSASGRRGQTTARKGPVPRSGPAAQAQ